MVLIPLTITWLFLLIMLGCAVHDKLFIHGGWSFSRGLLNEMMLINVVTISAGMTEK